MPKPPSRRKCRKVSFPKTQQKCLGFEPRHVDRQSGALTTRPRCRQKEDKIQKEVFYSIDAIDESIDNTDSAQVLVFIRAITGDFHCFEELLCVCTLKDRTRGIDIFMLLKRNATKQSSVLLTW